MVTREVTVVWGLFHSAGTYWMLVICWALCQAVGPRDESNPYTRYRGWDLVNDNKEGEQ